MNDSKYFYVAYLANGTHGCMIIKQKRDPARELDGFNMVSCMEYLEQAVYKVPVMILFYQETSEYRWQAFQKYVGGLEVAMGEAAGTSKKSHLKLVEDDTPGEDQT